MKNNRLNRLFFLLGFLSLNFSWGQDHALNFDGIKDYVQWGDPEQGFPGPYAVTPIVEPLVGSDFTIELWMKSDFDLWPGPHGLLWAYNSYNPNHASNRLILGINTSGKLYIHDGVNNGLSYLRWTGTSDITDGECHHIAFTHDAVGKITNVYVDGVIEGSGIATTFILGPTDVFSLGQEWDDLDGEHPDEPHAPSQFYYGDMDDIRIWTEERTIDEIADNQYTDFLPGEPNLFANFKVDQGIPEEDNTGVLFLENSTLFTGIDGDIVGFTRLDATSNFVVDECDPCHEVIDAGEDQVVCAGEEVTLTGTGGVDLDYIWTDGVVDGVPFVPDMTRMYFLTASEDIDCEYIDSVTITVNPLPIIDAGFDVFLCEGEELTLTGLGAGIDGTYDWTGGVIDGEPFVPMASELYTVTGTDVNGCENTDDIMVTVYPLPIIDAGEDLFICAGEEVVLTGTGLDAGGIYSWTGGIMDGVAFTPLITSTYTLTGTSPDGCENTADVTVVVNPIPIIDAGMDVSICEGEDVTLTGFGAGIDGTYIWTGGVIDGISFIPVIEESTYTVTGTDVNGCVNSDEVLVVVNPLPIVNFSGVELRGCSPHPVDFMTGTSGVIFNWEFGDGAIGGTENPSHTYNSEGVFDVTLTVTTLAGCTSTTTYFEYVTVIPSPIAEFTFITNDLTEGETSAQFENHSLYSNTYTWDFGDGSPTSDIEHPYHLFVGVNEVGFQVELKAFNDLGCRDSVTKRIKLQDRLIYYIPNTFTPDGDLFNEHFQPVFISGYDIYDFHMMIFNRWGEIVFESYDASYGWDGTYGNRGIVQDGVYIWTIEFGDASTDERHSDKGHINVLK